MLAEHSSTD